MSVTSYKVYPKQFRWDKIPTERNRVFVLMPFRQEFDFVYGKIKKALTDNGYICNRADELGESALIMNTVLQEIMKSRHVIADLTEFNPNVFYELGIAHSFKDVPNVIMIKQRGGESPFDISHLNYIEYDQNNLFDLTSSLLGALKSGARLSDFQESLDRKGIVTVVSENHESFVDRIQEYFEYDLDDLTRMLDGVMPLDNTSGYGTILSRYRSFIVDSLKKGETNDMDGVLRVYADLVASCPDSTGLEEYIHDCLTSMFDPYDAPEQLIQSWKTSFAIEIAETQKHLSMVLPYLIRYLNQTKTGGIDLNRYKVESYFMKSHSKQVNDYLIASISNEKEHVREYVSDIVGEKKLEEAREPIIAQLERERNVYAARSMIKALGKLGNIEDAEVIFRWVQENEDMLRGSEAKTVFNNAYKTLLRLSPQDNMNLAGRFKERYKDIMGNPAF